MDEPVDLERSRLLLVWLQARRAVDHCLSDLLAAGPAGERRVRERLTHVDELESRARQAFVQYRTAAAAPAATGIPASARDWSAPTPAAPPHLDLVPSDPSDDDDLLEVSRSVGRGGRGHR
ncbi:MAG: hypothetical protein ACQSGP_13415 [Frankia sp.]